jgi:hypothetical protein
MAELAVTDLAQPALLAKLERWLEDTAVERMLTTAVIRSLREAGIGLVDLDRQRCVVDERVYESALRRGRVGALFLNHRLPSADVWRHVSRNL